MLQAVVIVAGIALQVASWRLAVAGRLRILTQISVVLAVCGAMAALVRPPIATGRVDATVAVSVALVSGVALYVATRLFVEVAAGWPTFRAHVRAEYGNADRTPLVVVLAFAVLLAVPGEELFWRGLVQPRLQAAMPVLSGPALAWLLAVAVNAASGSLVFLAGAVVGGGLWAALALWTKGVLASVCCHAVWTALMVLRPPAAARGMMQA